MDLGLLIWAMEKSVKPAAFGARRTVVQVTFTDQPSKKQRWWFVNDNGQCQLCVDDPGFDVDLYVAITLPDMIYIWRGDLSISHALERGRLEAHGSARARRALPDWLGVATIAHVKSQRERAAA